MGKKKKLHDLNDRISAESQRISVLLEYLIFSSGSELQKMVLTEIAQEKANYISRMTTKINKILK